jgi:hypothetical protein
MSDLDARLCAAVEAALPCSYYGWLCDLEKHERHCPASNRTALLAALAPVLAEAQRDAAERLAAAEHRLTSAGYRRSCDIPACNCGDSWTHGGHANERLREISEALGERTQGRTILAAVQDLIARTPEAGDGE